MGIILQKLTTLKGFYRKTKLVVLILGHPVLLLIDLLKTTNLFIDVHQKNSLQRLHLRISILLANK